MQQIYRWSWQWLLNYPITGMQSTFGCMSVKYAVKAMSLQKMVEVDRNKWYWNTWSKHKG